MTNPAKAAGPSTIILFGLSPIGKPRAGTFKGTDVPAARKAAAKLGLSIIEVADQAGLSLAAKIPAGRIAAHDDKVVPVVSKDVYAVVEALQRPAPNVGNGPGSAAFAPAGVRMRRLPMSWDDIKVGDLVLAQDTDPADGWWRVTVVGRDGDLFKLRWLRSERGRPFQKHRLTLGLIYPGDNGQSPQAEPKKSSPHSGSAFPPNWAAIDLDQIVLAKEDGPVEQWWEAKTIKMDKDLFTLQWRDHPNLPPIIRPRLALGLVHPNPKVR
jgi:hypothetical protein